MTSLAEFPGDALPRPPAWEAGRVRPGSLLGAWILHYEALTGLSAAVEGGRPGTASRTFAVKALADRVGGLYAASRPAADYLDCWARLEALWQAELSGGVREDVPPPARGRSSLRHRRRPSS